MKSRFMRARVVAVDFGGELMSKWHFSNWLLVSGQSIAAVMHYCAVVLISSFLHAMLHLLVVESCSTVLSGKPAIVRNSFLIHCMAKPKRGKQKCTCEPKSI